jgi:Domain of unknown function (DUF6438)
VESYQAEISSVTLRRGACFGTCPVYQVRLDSDGTVSWEGERFVERLGRYGGQIDAADFSRLASFIRRANFFEWEPEYAGNVTDLPDYNLTVTAGSQVKTVRQNGVDEPPDFWVIAALVDGLAERAGLTPVKPAGQVAGLPQPADLQELPAAQSSRRIGFERAEVLTLESDPPQYLLTVSGTKPYLNMDVELVPLVYIRQPEYWGIEVVGSLRGVGLPTTSSYTVSLPLTGFIGTQGIEVIGAERSVTIEVPPDSEEVGTCRDWTAIHDHQPPGPSVLRVSGVCRFPTAGYSVELRRHEPQGINPADLLLDRVVQSPAGPAAEVITDVEVSYAEETALDYQSVTILPGGPSIKVEDVH